MGGGSFGDVGLLNKLLWIAIGGGREKIDELMPHIDEMVTEGLVTLEKVQVIKYRADAPSD